jgi:hypothetical protein
MMPSVKAPFENVGRGERVSIGPRDVASKRENLELLVREMTAEEQRERKIESSVQRAFIFWARFNDPGNHVQNLFFYTDGNSYLADKNLKQSGVSDTFAMIQYIGQGKWQKAQQTFNDLLWQFPVFFRDVYIHSWVFSFLASHAGLPTSLEGEKLVRLEADDPIGFVSKGPMDQALTLVFGKDRMPLRMSIDTTREMQEGAARTETARGIRPPAVRIIGNMLDLPFRREGDALSVAGKDLLPAQESDFNLKPLKLVYLTSRPHKFVGLDGATHIFTDLDMQKTVLEIRSVMEKGGLLVIPADGEHFTPEYIESMRRLGFEAVMSEAVKVRLSGEQVAVISESLKRGAGEAIREKLNGIGSEFMVFRLVNPKAVAEGELSFQLESGEQTEAERIASPYVNGSGGFDFSTVDWNQFPGIRFEAGDPVLIRAEVGEQEGFLRDLFSGLDVQRMQPYKIFQQLRERCLVRQSELWRLFPAAENRRSVILDKLARQFLWWMLDVNNRSGAMAFYERYDLGRFKGDLVSNYEALRDEILQPSNAKLWGASPLLGLGISAQQLRGELEAFAAFLSRESAQGDERLVGGETADTGRAEMRSASDEAEPSKNFETGRFEMRNSDEESSGGEELRARRKAEAAVLQKLFTVMDREIRETIREAIEKEGGGESGYLRFSYIQRTLARVKREKNEDGSLKYPEFQRFSENHGDVLFDIADYLFAEDTSGSDALLLLRGYHPIVPLRRSSGNALLFSPELSEEMETLWAVVDHVAGYGEDPSFEKPAEILRELEQWEKHYLIGVIIHRLARQMESASAKTVARTRDFLKQYLSDRLNRSGGLILGFCRKLIDDYLRKEYEAVFIGRGTEQLQRITRKMLVRDGQDEYLPKLREIFLSTDLVKASGEEQRAEYFGREHLFDLNKAVIVDAGFYASVARPLVKLLKRSAIQAEFFLFQYRSVNAPKGSLRRLLADLRDTVFEYGTGYNAVLDPRERYLPQFTSAVFLIDDLLGKKYEAVYRFGEDRLPETRPTLTPKYYELSNQVVDEWFEREMAARQEGGEGTARRAELRNAIDPLGGILPAEKDAAKAGQMRRELSRQTAVFYPAALNDTPSLSVLNALFPDSRIIYNDALLMRKQGALSSFHYAKKHPGLNLENIEDAIRMIRDLFMERKPGPAIQNIEAEVLRRERRVFRLKLFFSPEEARKQGRDTLSVEYRLGKFEDIADEFPAVYVNYPGFQGLLAGDAGFWRGVVDKIKPGGFLVIPEWVLRYLNGLATAQTDGARDLRELLAGHFETGVVLPSENGAPEIYAYRKRSELRSVSDEAEPSKNFETGRFEIRRESRRFAVRESLDSARFEMRSVGDFAPDELVLTKEQYGAVKREIFAIEDDFRSAKEKKVFGEGSSDAAFVNAFHDGYSDSTIALWSKVPREDGMIHLRRGDLEDDRGSLRLAREMFAVYRDNPAGFKLTEAMLQEGGRHFSRVVHQAAPLLENETAHVSKEAIDFVDGILGRLLAEIDRLLTLPEVRSEIRDENKVTVAGRFFGPMRARTAKAVGFLATFLPLMGAFGAIAIDTVHSRPHHFLMGGVGGFALQMIIRSFQSGGWKRMRLPRWETLKTDLIVNVSPLAMQYFNRERNIENPLTVHFIVGIILGAFFQAGEFLRAQFGRGAPANPDRSLFEREISTKNLRRYLLNIFFFGWVAKIFSVLLFTPVYKVVDQTSAKAFFFYEIAFAAVFILSRHFSLPFVFVLMAAGVLGNQLEKYLTGGVIDQIPAFEGDRMNFEDFAIDIGMAASGVMMVQLLVWLFKHRKDLYLRNLLSFRLQKEAAPRLPWYAAVAKYSLMFGLLLLPFGVKDRFTTSYQPNRPVAIKAVRVPTPASQFAFDEKVEFFFGQLNKGNRYNVGDFMLLKPVEKEIYLDLMFREREFLKKFILAKIEEAGGNPGLSYEKKVAAVRRSLGNNLGQLLLNMLDDIESLGELSEAALAKDAARFLDEFLYARHPAVSAFPGKNLPTASETNMTSLRRRLCINELLMGWRHPESDLIPEFEKRLGELAQKEPEKIIALGSQIDGFYLPEGFRQKVKNLTEKIARELKRQQEIRDQEEFDKARLREGVPEGMNDDRNPKSYDKLLAELSQQVPATISSAGFVRSEIREIGVEEFAVKLQARLSKRIDEMTAVVLAGPVVDANYVKALHAIVDAWGAQFRSSEVSEEQGAPTIAIDFGAGDGETTVDGLIDHLLGAGNFKTVIFSGMTKRAIERKARLTDAGIRVSTVKNPDGISSGQIYPFRIYPVLSKNPHGKTRNPARINIEVRGREEAGTGWTPLEESVESGLQVFLAAYLVRELGDPARFLRADAGARAELLKKVHQMFSLTPDLLKYEIKEGRDGEPPQITFYTERPAFLSYLQNFAAQFKARTEVSSAA